MVVVEGSCSRKERPSCAFRSKEDRAGDSWPDAPFSDSEERIMAGVATVVVVVIEGVPNVGYSSPSSGGTNGWRIVSVSTAEIFATAVPAMEPSPSCIAEGMPTLPGGGGDGNVSG